MKLKLAGVIMMLLGVAMILLSDYIEIEYTYRLAITTFLFTGGFIVAILGNFIHLD